MVYLADDASGSNETFLAATSTSNLQIDVPAATRAGSRSFVLVYCQNALGRAAPAASVHFTDWALSLPSTTATWTTTSSTGTTQDSTSTTGPENGNSSTSTGQPVPSMGNLSFTDLDPIAYQLNGTVAWTAPADTSAYLHYGVWLLTRREYSTSVYEILLTGSQVNDPTSAEGNVPVGTNQLSFAQTRDLGSNGYAQYLAVIPNRVDNDMVASYNEAGFLGIVDVDPVSLGALQIQSVAFTDEDSVATYIQGQVTWKRQENVDYAFVEACETFQKICNLLGSLYTAGISNVPDYNRPRDNVPVSACDENS